MFGRKLVFVEDNEKRLVASTSGNPPLTVLGGCSVNIGNFRSS